MDWFKRYGIPGTYFLALVLAWTFACYNSGPLGFEMEDFLKFSVFTFLPVGYLLSIVGQLCYFWSPRGGLHGRAARRLQTSVFGYSQTNLPNEPYLEALSCLNAAFSELIVHASTNAPTETDTGSEGDAPGNNYLDAHKFIQEWIRKRMDVIAINRTILIATLLALLTPVAIKVICGLPFQPSCPLIGSLLLLSIAIIGIALGSMRTLEEQVVVVIAEAWQRIPPRTQLDASNLQNQDQQ